MNIFQGKKIILLSDNFNKIELNLETGQIKCGGAILKFGEDYLLADSDSPNLLIQDHDGILLMEIDPKPNN